MPDVTDATSQVGEMLIHALQNTFGMSPHDAIAQAQAETGVSDATINSADMGQALNYACSQPGLSPETQSYLTNASANYNSYGNVNQSGSTNYGSNYGGSNGGGGYGSSGGGASSNAQLIQQVTQNYNYENIDDNHIDILGNVQGDIDIDQQNSDIHDIGDGNAINTGDGDQNAATGDHSSVATAYDGGDAISNTGDGSVVGDNELYNSPVGDNNTVIDAEDGGQVATDGGTAIQSDGPVATDGGTAIDSDGGPVALDGSTAVQAEDSNVATNGSSVLDNRGGSIDDHSASHGGVALDNSDGGSIDDSSLGFGSGDVQGDVSNDNGSASSQGGHASGANLNLNLDSDGNNNDGDGNGNHDGGFGHPIHETLTDDDPTVIHEPVQHEEPLHADAAEHDATPDDGGDDHHALDDHIMPS
jgi:hypothetical protein